VAEARASLEEVYLSLVGRGGREGGE